MAQELKHWTDAEIEKFERSLLFSVRGIESWLRHLLVDEKKRLDYCEQHLEWIADQRMVREDSVSLKLQYERQQTMKGELKANVRGLRFVLDAWPKFVEKAFNAYVEHGPAPTPSAGEEKKI